MRRDANRWPGAGRTLLAAILLAGIGGILPAAEGADALSPLPRSAPLAPGPESAAVDEDDRTLRALDKAARERDERIQAILRASAGLRPVAGGDLGPGLAQPRAERDKALDDLRAALDDYLGRTHSRGHDQLDAHGAARQVNQTAGLSAANRVAVIECMQQLCGVELGEARRARLEQGMAELAALPEVMDETLRPRAAYLQVWFLAESARLETDPAAKAERAGRARTAAASFAGTYPDSELAAAVAALVADLPAAPPAP